MDVNLLTVNNLFWGEGGSFPNSYSCPPPGVPARLRDIWHGGEDAGGQGPQPGEAAASSPEGEPGGDPRTLPGGTEPLHRRAGRGGPAVGTFRL